MASMAAEPAAGPGASRVLCLPERCLTKVLDFMTPIELARCQRACTAWREAASDEGLWRAHVKACVRVNTSTRTVEAVRARAAKGKSWRKAFPSTPRLLHDGFFVLQQQYYSPAYNDLWHKTDEAYLRIIFQRVWWFFPDGTLLYLMKPGDEVSVCRALRRGAAEASATSHGVKRLSMMRVHEAFWASRRGPDARSLLWVMAREDGADESTLALLASVFEPPQPGLAGAAHSSAGPTTLPAETQGAPTHDTAEPLEPWQVQRSIWLGGDMYASPAELGVTSREGLASIVPPPAPGGESAVPPALPHGPAMSGGSGPSAGSGVAEAWKAFALAAARGPAPGTAPSPEGAEQASALRVGGGVGGAAAGREDPAGRPAARRGRARGGKRGGAAVGTEGVGGQNESRISFGVWELHGSEVCCTIEVPNTARPGAPAHVCAWRLGLGSGGEADGCARLTILEQSIVEATADAELGADPSRPRRLNTIEGEELHFVANARRVGTARPR